MDPPSVRPRREPVDRGADERMAEAHPLTDRDQVVGVEQRLFTVEPHTIGGLEEELGIADRLGGRDQQQPLRRGRHPLHPTREGLLDAGRQRSAVGQPEASRELCRVAAARQLEQRQRVAGGLGDDAVADAIVQPAGDHGLEQRPRVVVRQTLHGELREPRQRVVLAGRP